MSKYKVGDTVKKPNGKCKFKILHINTKNRRKFGDWYVENLTTGRQYMTFSNQGWVIYDPFKPKNIEISDLRFDFKNGI